MFLKNSKIIHKVLISDYWSLCYKTGKDSEKFLNYADINSRVTQLFFLTHSQNVDSYISETGTALYTNLHI